MNSVWKGADVLRDSLVEIASLNDSPLPAGGDVDRMRETLSSLGQVRPVLVAPNRSDVVGRQHLLDAARSLGWTHIAVRLKDSEELVDDADQLTMLDELAGRGDTENAAKFAKQEKLREADESEIAAINEASKDPDHEWVGLPEFVKADDALRVVVSVENEADREALFDVLGISTIHKGTRGTLSVWWPDKARKDLASLRFVSERRAA